MLSLVQQKPVSLAFLHAEMYKTRDIARQLQLQGQDAWQHLMPNDIWKERQHMIGANHYKRREQHDKKLS